MTEAHQFQALTLFDRLTARSKLLGRKLEKAEVIEEISSFLATLPKPTAVRKKAVSKMSDEEWITDMEADPSLAGIDIKRELGRCQFWCKNNSQKFSRKRFGNWLLKADRTVNGNYNGQTSNHRIAPDIYKEPSGWQDKAKAIFNGLSVHERNWFDLSADIRTKIVSEML